MPRVHWLCRTTLSIRLPHSGRPTLVAQARTDFRFSGCRIPLRISQRVRSAKLSPTAPAPESVYSRSVRATNLCGSRLQSLCENGDFRQGTALAVPQPAQNQSGFSRSGNEFRVLTHTLQPRHRKDGVQHPTFCDAVPARFSSFRAIPRRDPSDFRATANPCPRARTFDLAVPAPHQPSAIPILELVIIQ